MDANVLAICLGVVCILEGAWIVANYWEVGFHKKRADDWYELAVERREKLKRYVDLAADHAERLNKIKELCP